MYLHYFGLREYPFSLTPDTSFFFDHPGQREALNVLLVALRTGEGFIKVSGEVGTGKTLLCRKLLEVLHEEFLTAYLPNPLLKPIELYRAVAVEIGLTPGPEASFEELLRQLASKLIELAGAGRRVVLLIDEVQAMSDRSLEALRLLSNLETEKRKLLQIVLLGQPELDRRLRDPGLRQLRQRIAFAHRLTPLDRQTVEGYLAHRLKVAGYNGEPLFTGGAIAQLHRASRGIPRLVNILAHKALFAAYGRGVQAADRREVVAAARDTEDASRPSLFNPARWLYSGIALLLALELGAFFFFSRGGMP